MDKRFKQGKFLLKAFVVVALLVGVFYFFKEQILSMRAFLDSEEFSVVIGRVVISPYKIIKGLSIIIIFYVISKKTSSKIYLFVRGISHLNRSNQILLTKVLQILSFLIFFLLALSLIGIDITALSVLGGAVGIGLGFGLQKITSNFISGLILLFERSIEEGDLIELENSIYGFVRRIRARHTLVETFDGKEIIIPNEDFITRRVINWTYSSNKGRVEVRIGVSYDSDIEKAKELILEAAKEHKRAIPDPPAECFVTGFADSAVEFLLFFWVDNVSEGRFSPKSDVMVSIWKKFRDNNISIPFPQQDIHIKNISSEKILAVKDKQ